jgi:hypothetical protein
VVDQQEQTRRERASKFIKDLVPNWRPSRNQRLWTTRIVVVLGLSVAVGYSYGITLWDWLKLLIVPAVIAAGGLWFNAQQQDRQREDNRQQHERGLAIENERAQDQALQAYLDHIGELLLGNTKPLRQSKEADEVRTLARARTLTVLSRLDGERKGRVLQFLHESGLIIGEQPILSLSNADLQGAVLDTAEMSVINLDRTNLSHASLSGVNLNGAFLREVNLHHADMVGVSLSNAILENSDLELWPIGHGFREGRPSQR